MSTLYDIMELAVDLYMQKIKLLFPIQLGASLQVTLLK